MKPISNTAFYCCGVRMQDAENELSVCQDTYAKYFMNERGMEIYSAFEYEINPNAGNVTRHRIIDDFLRRELADNPALLVILIGAGFDSRAYRINGGNWIELDEPQIISYKNDRLSVEDCKNRLQRIAIDFETESLESKLRQFASNQPVIVIMEGVLIYLPEENIKNTLDVLKNLFPNHKLACDLMTDHFFKKYSYTLHQKLGMLGANFKFTIRNPSNIFYGSGYRLAEKHSIIGKTIELGVINIPVFIFKFFLKTLKNGYAIYVFESCC